MSGTDADESLLRTLGISCRLFDFIIIDECHRGGANDESNWRGILEYFSPAVQLGINSYSKSGKTMLIHTYFGEPVYIYSLKEGITMVS
jgi:type I restriction enzyme R subunit